MNRQEYLRRFEKALKGAPKSLRSEILQEMRVEIRNFAEEEAPLTEHFGLPEMLAKDYIKKMDIRPGILSRLFRVATIVLALLGLLLLLLTGVLIAFGWYYSQDKFDYANKEAALMYFDGVPVAQFSLPLSGRFPIDIIQSEVLLYGHQGEQLITQCKGARAERIDAAGLQLKHNFCLVLVPSSPVDLTIRQATVTVVRPLANMDIDLWQAQLRLALEGGEGVALEATYQESDIVLPPSTENAPVTLKIHAEQSRTEPYRY